ncbi:hypothetical protein BRD20_01665 [Halobacteriales archaeon SW_8_65_20]|nr:MAG: hypothetical protein BRC71_04615 [Halobacteriales archaeon QH_7_65_31]PSQ31203.1 MAG: hypothetical protein BRD16_03485 [Halobacteriales archaeon SW_6_65_46]PSQ53820.1 MAG: hypothetical protein BRD20_01665 [Halobacteriales archaeon SW_8_65_20]
MNAFTLQSIAGGGLLALVVTFLLTALFYAFTLHLAATFFIGDVPSQRAAYAGPVPALVSILLGEYGQSGAFGISASALVGVGLVVVLAADLLAVSVAYRLKLRSAIPVVVLHFAFAAILGLGLANLLGVGLF